MFLFTSCTYSEAAQGDRAARSIVRENLGDRPGDDVLLESLDIPRLCEIVQQDIEVVDRFRVKVL